MRLGCGYAGSRCSKLAQPTSSQTASVEPYFSTTIDHIFSLYLRARTVRTAADTSPRHSNCAFCAMSTKSSPDPGPSGQETVFHEALERFKASLSDNDREDFQFVTLDDLQAAIAAIQEKQASEKKMRNLTRLKKFLEAMDEYGKVLEIFLNNSQFIAFVWVSLDPRVRCACA
jgi:hypothetical protein